MKKAQSVKYLIMFAMFVSMDYSYGQSALAFELSAGISSTQSLSILKQSHLKSDNIFLPKDLDAGFGYDIGADVLLKARANYFKTGIHLNSWSSKIAIANNYFKNPLQHSGEIKIHRFSVPVTFVLTGKNVNSTLKINHEFGFILDQNLRSASKYFNVLFYENYYYQDANRYIIQPDHIKAKTSFRFHYGINAEIGKNVFVGLQANLGLAESLVMPEMLLRCGLDLISGESYDHYMDPRFETIDVFELGATIAYRFHYNKKLK